MGADVIDGGIVPVNIENGDQPPCDPKRPPFSRGNFPNLGNRLEIGHP